MKKIIRSAQFTIVIIHEMYLTNLNVFLLLKFDLWHILFSEHKPVKMVFLDHLQYHLFTS